MPKITPPFYECLITVPPPQEGTPKFVIGDLDHEFMKGSIASQLRRYTTSGMEEYLQDMTFEQHGVVVDTMKQTKAAVSGYNILLVKTARNCKDEPIHRKITKLQFTYQRLHTEFTNAINRMKNAGSKHFGQGEEMAALGVVPAGVGDGVQVLGIVSPEVQPAPPTAQHPDDVKEEKKRKYVSDFSDSKEEVDAEDFTDLQMYEYLGKKLARKAELEKEFNIIKLEAALVESQGQVSAAEDALSTAEAARVQSQGQVSAAEAALVQSQGQVSAAEAALVQSKGKLEEAHSNLGKAKKGLE